MVHAFFPLQPEETMTDRFATIILAAGQGKRMHSSLPKALHPLAGKPMIDYALKAAVALSPEPPVVVVGHGAQAVQKAVGEGARFVYQEPQLGTAHAVQMAAPLLAGKVDLVLVTCADTPLLRIETMQRLVEVQKHNPGPLSLLTVMGDGKSDRGRVIRRPDSRVLAVVEQDQASPEASAGCEQNAGLFCMAGDWLWDALLRLPVSPAGEYYLTGLVELAASDGLVVETLCVEDAEEALGVNDRLRLAKAEAIMRRRINTAHMLAGVTIINPENTYIESDVQIGADTILWPNTYLRGNTVIGCGCTIGPNTIMEDCRVGNDCTILAAVMEKAVLEDGVDMGPFARLRKGAHLAKGVHMGNFGEIKNSYLGPGTKMGHFSYIGDATIGVDVNIGAGTITCNFDGVHKLPTEIGDHAFIGSDTMLVAPVKIGEGARTGAGTVVTHDVPPGETVVGVPARPLRKQDKGDH
jgi:bifunctional UDP-N-acetylglucosamine pyrophosphorylase/glucosamine-1-phosphate N-acetyltransferase